MNSSDTPKGWFALGTFAIDGRAFPGLVLEGERVIDLSGEEVPGASTSPFSSTRQIFDDCDANLTALTRYVEQLQGTDAPAGYNLASLRVLPPIEPAQILQSGANYRKHVVDLGVAQMTGSRPDMTVEEIREETARMMDERIAHGEPYTVLVSPDAMCGGYDYAVLALESEEHDWELEFAAVVGRTGRHVPVERAMELVAGYTIVNDLTTRDLVYRPDLKAIGTDWVRSKNSPTFLPTGPYVVPAPFVPDTSDLRITLKLNGKAMQDESSSDMIFGVARLMSYASSRVSLRPGDLILTGSPAGNESHWGRFLTDGDVMEGEVTGLGWQRNRCVREADRVAVPPRKDSIS